MGSSTLTELIISSRASLPYKHMLLTYFNFSFSQGDPDYEGLLMRAHANQNKDLSTSIAPQNVNYPHCEDVLASFTVQKVTGVGVSEGERARSQGPATPLG